MTGGDQGIVDAGAARSAGALGQALPLLVAALVLTTVVESSVDIRRPVQSDRAGGTDAADERDLRRRPLRVVLPDEPALPRAAAAVLLRILRTASRTCPDTPNGQRQTTIEE